MSFLVDPPLLIGAGVAIEELAPSEKAARIAGAAVLGVFIGTSISLYLEKGWTKPVWKAMGARSGRDWMLNSGVTAVEYRDPPRQTDLVAAGLFATYPLWLHLGRRLARRRERLLS
ncbi:MAG: hypothetical protein JJLCMIEE_02889 [Acidimicrobiales bacterium]|nr:MAG: hypothetical protein EDR02_14985 [Actinomycetota bacterium]MBV6509790.1 hypothetical protein [Acidimicrobiales bacterium]